MGCVESSYRGDFEAGESGAIAVALVEDRRPGKARLRAFEHEELEENPIVVDGTPHSES